MTYCYSRARPQKLMDQILHRLQSESLHVCLLGSKSFPLNSTALADRYHSLACKPSFSTARIAPQGQEVKCRVPGNSPVPNRNLPFPLRRQWGSELLHPEGSGRLPSSPPPLNAHTARHWGGGGERGKEIRQVSHRLPRNE